MTLSYSSVLEGVIKQSVSYSSCVSLTGILLSDFAGSQMGQSILFQQAYWIWVRHRACIDMFDERELIYIPACILSFCCHLTGGGHGKSDQDQRERPVGGRVQGQTRPLSLHPRSTVGTTPSWRRELRNTRTPTTCAHPFSFGHSVILRKKKIYTSTQFMNLWAKPIRPCQHKACWLILPNVILMDDGHTKSLH